MLYSVLTYMYKQKMREKKKRQYSRPGPTQRQFYVVIVWAPGKKIRESKEVIKKEEKK